MGVSPVRNFFAILLISCFSASLKASYLDEIRLLVPFRASRMASSCLRFATCLSYFFTRNSGSLLSFTTAFVVSCLTREANLSVEIVSSRCLSSGQMLPIMTVLQLPPRASLSTLVSLDCRKGTKAAPWSEAEAEAPSSPRPLLPPAPPLELEALDSAFTVCSRNERDLLMNMASFRVWPDAWVFFVRSLPARSTHVSLD